MGIVNHIGVVFAREIRPDLRNPVGLLFSMAQPLVFLLLFGPLLSFTPGADMGGGTGGGGPWQWFVPGILVMLALFGTSGAGYFLLVEMAGGSLERILVTPLNRVGILLGRSLKEIVVLLAQAVLIVLCLLPAGFRVYPAGALVGLLVLATLGVGIGGLSYALALKSKGRENLFYGVHQTVLFPLLLLSGVLLPLDAAPSWLATAAGFNPMKYVVDAERVLFAGELWEPAVLHGMAAALVVAAVGLFAGTRAMRRATL